MSNSRDDKHKQERKPKQDNLQSTLEYVKSFIIALLLALLIKATVIEAYKIPTPSMESTLLAGDFIIGNKFIYGIKIPFTDVRLPAFREPKRGDIIIFRPPHSPHENYVKRCVGLPGDTIQVVHKQLYINGQPYHDSAFIQHLDPLEIPSNRVLSDPYTSARFRYGVTSQRHRPFAPFRDNSNKIVIPEGKYFMMGDNRDNSLDSRMWGFVDRDQIMGKALIIHWSWDIHDQNAPDVQWSNPLTVIHNVGYNLIHFYERVNWDRLGSLPD